MSAPTWQDVVSIDFIHCSVIVSSSMTIKERATNQTMTLRPTANDFCQ